MKLITMLPLVPPLSKATYNPPTLTFRTRLPLLSLAASSRRACAAQRWHHPQPQGGLKASVRVLHGTLAATAVSLPRSQSEPRGSSAPLAACPVLEFIAAFNQRDLERMAGLLAPDCQYHNLGLPQAHSGKEEVRRVLQSLMAATPPDWQLVVDDSTASTGSQQQQRLPRSVGVTWRMVAQGRSLPLMSGLSFYRLDQQGRIAYIKEAAEQLVKLPAPLSPLLGGAAPLLQLLAGPAGAAAEAGQLAAAAASQGVAGGARNSSSSAGLGVAAVQSPLRTATSAAQVQPNRSGSFVGSSVARGAAQAARSVSAGSTEPSSSAGAGGSLGGLAGVWLKDVGLSDMASYERMLGLLGITGLQRTTAVQLLEGVELEQSGATVNLRFLTVVPFFKITEPYSLTGTTKMQRRDLQRGQQQATARVNEGGELVVDMSWDAPNPGSLVETYTLLPSGQLQLTAVLKVGAGAETTRQVFRRAERWTPRFKWPGGGFWGSGA